MHHTWLQSRLRPADTKCVTLCLTMVTKTRIAAASLGLLCWLGACKDDDSGGAAGETEGDSAESEGASDTEPEDDPNEVEPLPEGHARVIHSFGNYTLGPNEEIQPCIQWTLENDAPLYVNRVTLTNQGGYHHSNWFVIPEDTFEGPDGFYECDERNFTEIQAAISGSVIFAQSTQSRDRRTQAARGGRGQDSGTEQDRRWRAPPQPRGLRLRHRTPHGARDRAPSRGANDRRPVSPDLYRTRHCPAQGVQVHRRVRPGHDLRGQHQRPVGPQALLRDSPLPLSGELLRPFADGRSTRR